MSQVEDFISEYDGKQGDMLRYFHEVLITELNLQAKIRFKIPFYFGNSWICYMNPIKGEKIEFAFTRGNELSNSQGILESKGRKQVYSVEFTKVSEIQQLPIFEIIQEAILLDESLPYRSKRSKKP